MGASKRLSVVRNRHQQNGRASIDMEKAADPPSERDPWDESLNGLAPDADALARVMAGEDPKVLEGTRWSYDDDGILTLTLSGRQADVFCATLADQVREVRAKRT
jgi:hypothetical protein